ncbi:hypothetical protein ACJZ2D_012938 [Fusarium nematophilum]
MEMEMAAIRTPPSSSGGSGGSGAAVLCTPTNPQRIDESPGDTPVSSASATPSRPTSPPPRPLAFANKRPSPSTPTPAPRKPSSSSSFWSSTLASSSASPQQELGSTEYLSRLLRLVRCRPTRARSPSSAMADFLSSFNLGAQTPAASNNPQCDSVQDLQLHLRGILDAKATPNRAEHVSITLELRATVRFELAVSEPENGALENLNNIDPSLGGARSAAIPADQAGGQLSRVVFANDTLMSQPNDDPALQRSVAKHIISVVSSTDGSTWTVREVSRAAQGWTFTYLCKDSYQQWSRQTAKNPNKAIVGEFSQREPDPVLHARPAFDCRGSVTIAFNRSSRAITVKYDHTPLHKTVAQLAEYFKPPPRQLGPGAQKLQQQKEKTPRKQKGEKRERKKQESTTKAQDENGNPRKRRKKNNGTAQPTAPQDGPMIPPDYPGAPPVDGQAQAGPSYSAEDQQHAVNSGQNQQGFSDYPQGLIGGDAPAATNGSTAQQPSASINFPVNVSAAEAARRREAALTMLTNAGVEPATLSNEQFSIFANQAPELQRESLSMLVKYGAERLRIVHPSNREGSAQTNASAPSQSSQTTPSGPRTTKELVPQSGAQSNAGTDNEASAAVNGVDGTAEDAQGSKSTPGKRKKMAKSRTACFPCKARKTKCPKERPTCAECSTRGTACEYAPQKPRNVKKKSETIVVEDDEDEDDEEEQEDAEGEAPDEHEEIQQGTPQEQDYSSYPQMNIGNMVTASTDPAPQGLHGPQSSYFQSGSGLVLPQPDPYNGQQPMTADPSLVMPRQTYGTGMPEVHQPIDHAPAPTASDTIAPERRWTAIGPSTRSRRSLPSGPAHPDENSVSRAKPQASDWVQTSNANMPATTMASVSPQMAYSRPGSQRSRQANQPAPIDAAQLPGQSSSVSSTVMQQQARQSPVAAAAMMAQARKSPYQQAAVPRTSSRQGQRNQSLTPVADKTRGYQPPSDVSHQHNTRASTHHDTAQMPGASGYNDYGRHGSNATSAGHQQTHRAYDQTSSTSLQQTADASSQKSAMAMSIASGTPSTMSTSYPTATSSANQWSSSSGRNDRSYNSNSAYQSHSSYSQPSDPKPASASRQNLNMRGSAQQHTRAGSSSNSHQQQQSYSSYSAPTQNQHGQATNQQQSNWYFQNSHNSQPSGYNYEPWSGV